MRNEGPIRRRFVAVAAAACLVAGVSCGGDDDDSVADSAADSAVATTVGPTADSGPSSSGPTSSEEPDATASSSSPSSESDGAEPIQGGTVSIGHMFPVTVDAPWNMTSSVVGGLFFRALYDTFLYYDENGEPAPWLAESWTVSDDNRVFTFELREGVKFHDGTDFDAEAAEWNILQHLDPERRSNASAVAAHIESVEATSPTTLVITTKAPYPAFIDVMIPSSLTAMASPTAIEADPRARVGTGPFRVVSYQAGESVAFERNPDYWQEGKPNLDAIEGRTILDNSARTLSLQEGEVDVVGFVEGQYFKELEEAGFNRETVPMNGALVLEMTNARPPVSDPRVREALVRAIDLDVVARAIFDGEAWPNPALIPLESEWRNDDVEYPAFDQERARQLVDEYEAENGPIEITFTSDNINYMRTLGEIGVGMWRDVGIDVEVETLETNVFLEKMRAGEVDLGGLAAGSPIDPDVAYYNTFHSESPSNFTKYSNPEMDELLEAGRVEIDEDARREIYARVQELMAEDLPLFGYLQTYWGYSTAPDIQGWTTHLDTTVDWTNVWRNE